jgi:hypothetical protein
LPSARALGATAGTGAISASTITKTCLTAVRFEDLLAAAATEIRPILAPATKIAVSKLLLHVGVVVFDALTMLRIVLPIVSACVDID